jgi:putative endonuclease
VADVRKGNVPMGRAAETAVADELVRRGMFLLARNYRFRRLGEIDLVAADRGAVCFVEVKARSNARFGAPVEAVTPGKARRIRLVASCFLQERHLDDREVRFLAASVQCESDGRVSCIDILPFD